MTNSIDSLPRESANIIIEVLASRDKQLLRSLQSRAEPSYEERAAVTSIMTYEFALNLREDDEPTERGKLIDNALGAFLTVWPTR